MCVYIYICRERERDIENDNNTTINYKRNTKHTNRFVIAVGALAAP